MHYFKKLFSFLRKIFTHNFCNTCGFTKSKVSVYEHYLEAGYLECENCRNKRITEIKEMSK